MKKAYKIVSDAIKILETKGWQRAPGHNGGPACIMTALSEAEKGTREGYCALSPVQMKIQNLIKSNVGFHGFHGYLFSWNDRPTTTKEMVLAELKKAKRALR